MNGASVLRIVKVGLVLGSAMAWMLLTGVILMAAEPIPAPPLPDTSTGWLDFVVKVLPVLWGIMAPAITAQLQILFPRLLAGIPRPLLGVISAIVGAVAGALTGSLDSLLLNGGGISPDVGAVEGILSAATAHRVASTVTPGEVKPAQP